MLRFNRGLRKGCSKCGSRGVIYKKEMCHSCYFGFEKKGEALRQ
jgi:ribosomal protein L37E